MACMCSGSTCESLRGQKAATPVLAAFRGAAVGCGGDARSGGVENRTCAAGGASSWRAAGVAASWPPPPVTRLRTLAASVDNVSTLLRMPPSTENMTFGRVGLTALEDAGSDGGFKAGGVAPDLAGCSGAAGEAALLGSGVFTAAGDAGAAPAACMEQFLGALSHA